MAENKETRVVPIIVRYARDKPEPTVARLRGQIIQGDKVYEIQGRVIRVEEMDQERKSMFESVRAQMRARRLTEGA